MDRLYWGSDRNGLVLTKHSTYPARLCCLRSFCAARLANSVTASASSCNSVIGWPNDRVQAISCLGCGTLSRSTHCVPCSSRTVRSTTTLNLLLIVATPARTRSRTIVTPPSMSCAEIRRPMPHTSPTGVTASTASSSSCDSAARLHISGMFGLVPHWATDTKIARQTYNARSETAAEKPSYRDAWKRAQHCIIPAAAIYEPDWRSGKAVATRIERADDEPMGIAGLWASWKSPKGELLHSYTMLTINANGHDLMQQLHKPTDEKRMVVVLAPERYQEWLQARPEQSMAYMRPMAPAALMASVDTNRVTKNEKRLLF